MPFFLILCLKSRDNLEPWPLMAFLRPSEEIVYYHYSRTERMMRREGYNNSMYYIYDNSRRDC